MSRWVLLGALLCCACLRLDPFLYNPTVAPANADLLSNATAVPAPLRLELQGVQAADGTPVSTWMLRHNNSDGTPPQRHSTAILYCHGNAQNVAFFVPRVEALWSQGYTVLLFDYRGYGKTPGTPTEAGVYADARAALGSLMNDQGFAAGHIALYGYSLGGAVCSQMAAEMAFPALILESTFASVAEFVDDNEGLAVPTAWYADARMATRSKIRQHHGALLVVHGANDTFVQPRYGQEIHSAAAGVASPNLIDIVPGATHDTAPCAIPSEVPQTLGTCVGGFSADYLREVSELIDGAIPAF